MDDHDTTIWPLPEQCAFYKEWFYKELDRAATLNASLNLRISVVIALAALMYFLFSQRPPFSGVFILFWAFFVFGGVAWLLALRYLVRALLPPRRFQAYAHLPSPDEIEAFRKQVSGQEWPEASSGENYFWETVVDRLRAGITRKCRQQ